VVRLVRLQRRIRRRRQRAGRPSAGWLIAERLKDGHATTLGGASGAVAGLVAITPCAGFVGGMSPIIIGFIAGVVCYLAIGIKRALKLDDSLDVIAVHLVGGIVGSLLLGFFGDASATGLGTDGVLFDGGTDLLVDQLTAVGAAILYSAVATFIIAKAIDLVVGLRVDDDAEEMGLDLSQHAETAYTA
jgi:ammonium transporter, Amt family